MSKHVGKFAAPFCCEISDEDYHNPALEAQIFYEKAEKFALSVAGGNIFMSNHLDDLLVPRDRSSILKKVS